MTVPVLTELAAFPDPVRGLCVSLACDPRRRVHVRVLPAHWIGNVWWLVIAGCWSSSLRAGSSSPARHADRRPTFPRTWRTASFVPGARSNERGCAVLRLPPGLQVEVRPCTRARAARRRWRGGPRRRRRRPQRAARSPARRHRPRDHGAARGGRAPRQGGRHQVRADRHRPRHRHPGDRRRSRSRSRRCARTSRPTAARPRSSSAATGRATPKRRDFTINALSVDADGIVHDHVGGLADIAARRVRFIGDAGAAHRRGLSAHPAFLSHACRLRDGRTRSRRISRLHRRACRIGQSFCRTRAHGNAQARGRGGSGGRGAGDGRRRPAAGDFRRCHLHRHVRGDDRGGTCAGVATERGTPAGSTFGRRHRGCQASRRPGFAFPTRKRRRSIRWAIAGGVSRTRTRRGRGGCSIGSARIPIATG